MFMMNFDLQKKKNRLQNFAAALYFVMIDMSL